MPRAPDTLEEARDRARRTELADQVDVADVDPELERGGRHQCLKRPALETLLRVQSLLPGEAAVVRADLVFTQALGQRAAHPLGQPASVHEHQRGAMRFDQPGQSVIDLLPDLAGHHGFERRGGKFEGEVTHPAVAGVDDRAFVAWCAVRAGADQKRRDRFDRLLGGRQAHSQQSIAAECRQALERKRQVGAALVRHQSVDLVDDHGPCGREHRAAGIGAEQDVERLRRGDDDVRRAAVHALALARRRVAGTHPGSDLHVRQTLRTQGLADAGKRRFQVPLDVVRQRLQRRDVDDLRLVPQPALQPLPQQVVDRCEKGRERLAGSRGRSDQGMPPRLDRRPRLRLGRRGRSEATIEPSGDRRLEQVGWARGAGHVRQVANPRWRRYPHDHRRPCPRTAAASGSVRGGAPSGTMLGPVRRGLGRSRALAVGLLGGARRRLGGKRYHLRFLHLRPARPPQVAQPSNQRASRPRAGFRWSS